MATLTANLDNSSDIAEVSEPLVVGQTYHLDDEVVIARSALVRQWADLSGLRWLITRGVDNTTKASHLSGATLTVARAFAEEGGAAEAGTVVVTLTGTETEYAHIYRGDEDPAVAHAAELEPGDLWIDTVFGAPFVHRERNILNDGWDVSAAIAKDALGVVLARAFVWDNSGTFEAVIDATAAQPGIGGAVRVSGAGTATVQTYDVTGSPNGTISIENGAIFMFPLPTADPVVSGQLWNNAGVVQVSAG